MLRSLYLAPVLCELLAELTSMSWRPSGTDGSYSYYETPGHHLGVHRDVAECDLAVITCVERWGSVPPLQIYPNDLRTPIGEVDLTGGDIVEVDLRAGESLVLLGGVVPHRLPPLVGAGGRTVAPLCFTPA